MWKHLASQYASVFYRHDGESIFSYLNFKGITKSFYIQRSNWILEVSWHDFIKYTVKSTNIKKKINLDLRFLDYIKTDETELFSQLLKKQ